MKNEKMRPVSEINMTPFIDVVLVLLIVFMITAPLMTVGVEIDLPDTQASVLNEAIEPVVVSVDARGQVYIAETAIQSHALIPTLKAMLRNEKDDPIIYLQLDKSLSVSLLMDIMGRLSKEGFKKVSVVGASVTAGEPSSKKQRLK
jgi:biopolymer transport protein TolR